MRKDIFLKELKDILQRKEPCHENDRLDSYEEWDSLSIMSVMAFFDRQFGLKISLDDFNSFSTVNDLILFAGDHIQP